MNQTKLLSPIYNIKTFVNNPLQFMLDGHEQNGDIFSVYLGYKKFHFICHPNLAGNILDEQINSYQKSRLIFDKIQPITGRKGLVQLENDEWQEMRRITGTVFQKKYMDTYIDTINLYSDELVVKIQKAINTTHQIDISQLMIEYTINIAIQIFCGHTEPKIASIIAEKFIELNYLCGLRMRRIINLPLVIPLNLHTQIKKIRNELRAIIATLIQVTKPNNSLNLLNQLNMQLKSNKNVTELIKDQMMTFIFAGYETSAASLTFFLYLLAQHSKAQERIREESIYSSTYTLASYKEALRLYPPAYMLAREALHPTKLANYSIKKGDNIILSIFAMHRHKNFWHNANLFLPERFLKHHSYLHHKFAFIPFGYGQRICSGMQLAMREAIIVIEKLLHHFKFSLSTQDLNIQALVTLHPKNTVNVIVEKR